MEINQSDESQLPPIIVGTLPRHDIDLAGTDLVGTFPLPDQEQDQPSPCTLVLNDHSPENTPKAQSLNSSPSNTIDDSVGYKLPFRYNCGKPPNRYSLDHGEKKMKYPIANYICTQKLSQPLKTFVHKLSSKHVPSTVQEALNDPKWIQAITEEMQALQKNGTWKLMPLPKGKKIMGCRWVFSIKHKVDGSIERYNARLVANGYTQTYGIDYQEAFSSVAKLNTVRVFLSLTTNLDWPLHQFDVKNAFFMKI